jgi:hypothetical protein
MTWPPDNLEQVEQALRIAVGEYLAGKWMLEGKVVLSTPRINEVLALATEIYPDGNITHQIIIR